MDYNQLVDEVLKRVMTILNQEKPKILLITRGISQYKKSLSLKDELQKDFCILDFDNVSEKDIIESREVIVEDLSLEDIRKISQGILDDQYVKTISLSILLGKTVKVLKEGVELFNYDKAPRSYYRLFEQQLNKLKSSNFEIYSFDKIINMLKKNVNDELRNYKDGGIFITKRVVTEKDMREFRDDGLKEIIVGNNTLITDIAKDFAQKNNIKILKK